MAQTTYDPNLGVLSAFQGLGSAMSQVGLIGLTDALETRRSKVENELRQQLKKEDQDFIVGQSDVKNDRDVAAAELKTTNDSATAEKLAQSNERIADTRAAATAGSSAGNKELMNKEMISPDGQTPVALDQVRKLYAEANGLNQEIIEWERVEPDFNKWAGDNGFSWRNASAKAPPAATSTTAITEEEARKRWAENPQNKDKDIDKMVEEARNKGFITGEATMPEAGFMDAMASDADPAAGNGQFGGGTPQGKPKGVLDAVEEQSSGTGAYSQMGTSMQSERNSNSKRASSIGELLKKKSTSVSSNARGRVDKKEQLKIQKVAKKARTALDKGTINQVSKANLQLALNDSAFVESLSEAEIKMLRDYLGN